jgi:hypothetical protein
MYKLLGRIPVRTIAYLIAGWIVLAIVNFSIQRTGVYTGVDAWFAMGSRDSPTIHLSGIPYLILFFAILVYAIRYAPKLNAYSVWLIGLVLVVTANLGQGGWDAAFMKPFSVSAWGGGIQYYHDAIKITSWSDWLGLYNANQHNLLCHTKLHPPFAVLTHYLVLQVFGNSVPALSVTFMLVSSLSIALVWNIFRVLGVPLENRNLLTLLYSVIPAVNIYTAVSSCCWKARACRYPA